MRRREVVKLGIVSVGCLACGGGGDDPTPDAIDGTGAAMCGANMCLDLNHPSNAMLKNVDGARAINIPGDKIIIVRMANNVFAVLTRTCTHQGCNVAYNAAAMELRCPCHGSRFSLAGDATVGPAIGSLKRYGNTFDEPTQTLTIILA